MRVCGWLRFENLKVNCWLLLWNLTFSVVWFWPDASSYRYIYPSIHPLYLSPSVSVLSSLPACSINGFSCIIWVGVLELMDWGGWHGFRSHSSCPVPFCKFPFSCINSTPLFLILSSAPSCLDSSPPVLCHCKIYLCIVLAQMVLSCGDITCCAVFDKHITFSRDSNLATIQKNIDGY